MKKKFTLLLVVLLLTAFTSSVYAKRFSFRNFFKKKTKSKQTQVQKTKYPVVLVPGVFAWDNLLGKFDYFYNIEDKLEEYLGCDRNKDSEWVKFIDLSPWENTIERGEKLSELIENHLELLNKDYPENHPDYVHKVNIIAHSHGATTSRVALNLIPQNIASLTTVAGPHYGTPSADYVYESSWTLKTVISTGLNLAAGFWQVLCGKDIFNWFPYRSQDVFDDFSQTEMKIFNGDDINNSDPGKEFPCAGVPEGGSYGNNSGNEETPLYGADAGEASPCGDGEGNSLDCSNPEAIHYYSFTGQTDDWATSGKFLWIFPKDLFDIPMAVTNYWNNSYGFGDDSNEKDDAFIPVTSARFGADFNVYTGWNHIDEMNQFLGMTKSKYQPVEIYRQYVGRLIKAGL